MIRQSNIAVPRPMAVGVFGALLLAGTVPTAAQTAAEPPKAKVAPSGVEARADEHMRRMADFLAKIPRFTMEAEETFDSQFERALRVQLTNVRQVTVQRPDRFASDANGDTAHRSSWYDGRALTVLNKEKNVYLTVEMPATIDGVLDKAAEDFGIVLPLSDFFYKDPYATLMEGVFFGKYLGLHQAAGVPCHHLAFGQEDIEWQIWIDAGAQPLPRKFAIAYIGDPGVPQYTAVFRRWTLEPKVTEELFRFKAPAAAKKIDLAALKQ